MGRTPSYCRNFDPQTRKVPVIGLQLPYPANYLAITLPLRFFYASFLRCCIQITCPLRKTLISFPIDPVLGLDQMWCFALSDFTKALCVCVSIWNQFLNVQLWFQFDPKCRKGLQCHFYFLKDLFICMSALFAWPYRLLWAMMWLLGTEIRISGRTASA